MAVALDNPESLADLSTLVERTLRDTARFFRRSGSVPSKTQLQRSVPVYYESFQQALDNLSEQIFIAKAFLEKDYDAIKARDTAPLAQDVVMGDADQKDAVDAQPLEPRKPEDEPTPVKVEEKPAGGLDLPGTADAPGPQPSEDVAVKTEQKLEPETAAEPSGQSLVEAQDGINFDSVLNEGGGGSHSFDLSLDFGDDDTGNQAFLSGSGLGGSAPSGLDQQSSSQQVDNNTTTGAPAGGGAFDLELSKSDGDANGFPDQNMDDFMGPGESNFDDLFLETDNLGGDDAGNVNSMEGDSLMNLDELDGDWFN